MGDSILKPVATVGAHGLMSYSNDRDPLPYGSKLYDAAAIETLQTELAQAREQVDSAKAFGVMWKCAAEAREEEIAFLNAQLAASMQWVPIAEADLQGRENIIGVKPDGSWYDLEVRPEGLWSTEFRSVESDVTHILRITPPGGSSDG